MPDIFINPEEEKPPTKESTHTPINKTSINKDSSFTKSTQDKEQHIHALSSYCEHPSQVWLHGKDITSSVKLLLRRHIVTNIPWIVTTFILLLGPIFLQILLTISPTSLPEIPTSFFIAFLLFYYLIVITFAFVSFLNWFYNIILITDIEIIDIDYSDIVYHDVAATNVNLIEDVQYVQSGFIQGLFNFGDVFVQTAGGKENIEAFAIPFPAKIARIILSFIGKGESH